VKTVLEDEPNFASLSIHDLLDARDLYHFHLLNKANVVGTAIGYYLVRKEGAWPTKLGEGLRPARKVSTERTLANSEVRDYSWPCVLVFVRRWMEPSAFIPRKGRKSGSPAAHEPTQTISYRSGCTCPMAARFPCAS